MSSAMQHCSLAITVNFLDLLEACEGAKFPRDDRDKVNTWHDNMEAFDRALADDVTDCNEVCINHQCWLIIEPASPPSS